MACLVSVVCNLLLAGGKIAVGVLTGSVAITADGMNNLSDASSNIVSLVGFKLGARPADSEHPYGHARYEYLAGLAVSVMILVIGVELLKESFAKVLYPTAVAFNWVMVAVLAASILVKLWMSALNKHIGTAIESETLLATAADARNDVITTAAVLAATILTKLTGFDRIDGLMGLGVAAFILYSGAMLVKDTIDPLLGAAPDPELVEHIEKKALSYPGVLGVHDLMIHDYGPGSRLVSFHLEMDAKDDVCLLYTSAVLEDGSLEHLALGYAHAQAEMTGGDIADDDFQRNDVYLLDESITVVDFLNVMGGDALFLQLLHQSVGQFIIDDALVADGTFLLAVACGGVVLVVDHDDFGVIGSENLLGLAFVQLLFNFVIHEKRSFYFIIIWLWLVCKCYSAAASAAMAASFLAIAAAVSARNLSSFSASSSSATARIATAR